MHNQKLYKIDSKGLTRVWWMEYDSSLEAYRTHSGIEGGKIVVSGWQYPTAKNVGRSNETTVLEQAELEIAAEYTKKLNQGKYHTSESKANMSGASFHECMLADKYNPKKHNQFPYYSQPKLDGVRCLVSKDGMQSRNGKPIVSAPHILEALQPFFAEYPDVVLDGELYNHDLKDNFEKIISLVRKTKPTDDDLKESEELVQYHVYDVITDETFKDRLNFVENMDHQRWLRGRILPEIQLVPYSICYEEEGISSWLGHWTEQGYEGQMLRVPDSPYEGKRSKFLIKHKEFEDDEFKIADVIEGKGNWAGCAKSIVIWVPDGEGNLVTQQSGVRGSLDTLKDVLYNANDYIGTDVTVRYQNKTEDNKLRFPVVVAFWKDKRDL